MDPFIEGQEWEDFHFRFVAELANALDPQMQPRYVVRVDRYVYVDDASDEQLQRIRPDPFVLEVRREDIAARGSIGMATAVAAPPVVLTLPMPEEQRIAYLTVRERGTGNLVTVIELLSPFNKRPNSDGRREYLRKRAAVIKSSVHLVELDLLRQGERLPTVESLPPADYYAFVSREQRRPKVEVYPWSLRHPLPTIPVPLRDKDPDARLDLQALFTAVYDRAGYDYSLDYRSPIEPPLTDEDTDWVQEVLTAASSTQQEQPQ
jgi:hypothetical protein